MILCTKPETITAFGDRLEAFCKKHYAKANGSPKLKKRDLKAESKKGQQTDLALKKSQSSENALRPKRSSSRNQ